MKLSKKTEHDKISRREFMGSVGAATIVLNIGGLSSLSASEGQGTVDSRKILTTFEYSGVQLSSSRWQEQYSSAQNFFIGISNDDILYCFRKAVAVVRGPLAMVMDARNHDSFPKLPVDEDELNQLLVAKGTSDVFRIQPSDGTHPQPKLYPFYKAGEGLPYSMCHDLDKLPVGMWQD